MTPTLAGRVQTRLLLLAVVGVPWTWLIVPLLPGGIGRRSAVAALAVVAALGVVWELVYHGFQQLRWDKDWPSLFALLAGVPESVLAYQALGVLGLAPRSVLGYALYFGSTWLLVWLVMQGPLRVVLPRWRHRGGRLLGRLLPAPARSDAPATHNQLAEERTLSRVLAAAVVLAAVLPLAASTGQTGSDGPPIMDRSGSSPPLGGMHVTGSTVAPVRVSVPKLGVSSTLIPLGLAPDGSLQTPSVTTPMQAGWYEFGPAPGEVGPAVIVGHVDGMREPGVFFRLRELSPGDEIVVQRADASLLRFIVRGMSQVPKDRFPTTQVYGPTIGPELRLITCGGTFDRMARSYRDNIIVFAEPDDTRSRLTPGT